ncbi:MAG: hypothetical protein ACFFCW_25360 [Candidatus Hodarchaeota archaeon]
MAQGQLRKTRVEARAKIEAQIRKGEELREKGLSIIKSKNSYQISARERDNFEASFEQWEGFTVEILEELFASSHYAYEFKKKQSSKVEYVGSGWIPDIEYYLEKQITPKIDYLNILIKNLNEFKDPPIQDNNGLIKEEAELTPLNSSKLSKSRLELPDKVTLSWLWEHVPVKFWIWAIGIIFTAFLLGLTVGQVNWIQDLIVGKSSPRVSENRQEKYRSPKLVTISNGNITLPRPGFYLVDTQGGIATDELRRIFGLSEGDQLILSAASETRTVVLRKNPHLKIQADFYLNSENDRIVFICNGLNVFSELSRASND